jgi:hypothetical protein
MQNELFAYRRFTAKLASCSPSAVVRLDYTSVTRCRFAHGARLNGRGLVLAPRMLLFRPLPQSVAFASSRFQIEDQVLHVEP